MSERAHYCHVVDVLRKFNPTITETNIDNDSIVGNEDRAQIRARIDGVGSDLERKTGVAWRRNRKGSPGTPSTYEYQDVDGRRNTTPLRTSLDHRPVLPFDSAEGDTLEIRTGRDSWTDVTDEAGDEFILDYADGTLKLYRILIDRIRWDVPDDRYLRATYRYGVLGGDQQQGGQTTLDGSVSPGDTTISVSDAARLPSRGILLINNSEYVRLTDVDHSADSLTVTRGERATSDESHSDGDVVHYAPEDIREAVAGRVAAELVRNDDVVDALPTPDDNVSYSDKTDALESEWQETLGQYADVKLL